MNSIFHVSGKREQKGVHYEIRPLKSSRNIPVSCSRSIPMSQSSAKMRSQDEVRPTRLAQGWRVTTLAHPLPLIPSRDQGTSLVEDPAHPAGIWLFHQVSSSPLFPPSNLDHEKTCKTRKHTYLYESAESKPFLVIDLRSADSIHPHTT